MKALNQKPLKSEIQTRGNTPYIPISFIEAKLDNLFGWDGWKTTEFKCQVVANEVIGSITLHVFSEKRGEWITREGSGAVQIMMKKPEQGEKRLATDIHAKILNALEMGYPHLKADCIKNAAKSLGKFFGRDVGRQIEETYTNIIESRESREFIALVESGADTFDVMNAFKNLPLEVQQMPEISKAFEGSIRPEPKQLEISTT